MNDQDLEFVRWWEANRDRERRWVRQLSIGLPLGLVFGLPIILSVVFRGWYKRMPYISGTQLILILMACLVIAVFYSIIRMRVRWDQREQRYQELKRSEK
jgi:hypothetical protein